MDVALPVAMWMWPYLQDSWSDHRLACNHCRDSLRLGPLRGEPRSQSVSFPYLSLEWSGNESQHSHNASSYTNCHSYRLLEITEKITGERLCSHSLMGRKNTSYHVTEIVLMLAACKKSKRRPRIFYRMSDISIY